MTLLAPFALALQTPTAPAAKPVAPLKIAPRAYFIAHCQRCHGVDGINFVPGFADEPLEKLRADIVRMADGPGGASLATEDVGVQLAYHRLMSEGLPFIAWTGRDGLVLKGEASDGATLKANIGTLKPGKDGEWTLTLASEADLARVRITATLDGKSSVLAPTTAPYAKLPEKKGLSG